ncbi:unnamed protein product [Phytophthora fragariaefolia]|uniref:Unnamed protein product n=1 Tax=Phytophthora fragariaefolia TaxID=1490495 RepID=A0A9W7D3E9_9STRA|nr:unnamed protein product [Phytophthora fragariaefolia]
MTPAFAGLDASHGAGLDASQGGETDAPQGAALSSAQGTGLGQGHEEDRHHDHGIQQQDEADQVGAAGPPSYELDAPFAF